MAVFRALDLAVDDFRADGVFAADDRFAADFRTVVFDRAPARFPGAVAVRLRVVDFFAGLMLALRVRAA